MCSVYYASPHIIHLDLIHLCIYIYVYIYICVCISYPFFAMSYSIFIHPMIHQVSIDFIHFR